MRKMNFSQTDGPSETETQTNPLLLYLASSICATWLIESVLAHIGVHVGM